MNTAIKSLPPPRCRGQGLVEYALLLLLVGTIVIVVLSLLGSQVGNVFCRIVNGLNDTTAACATTSDASDIVVITKADYDSGDEELHLDTTSNGSYNSNAILTASPGGVMEAKDDHYHLEWDISGCPCLIVVTSSLGGSASVTVGP